jgi:hypothetical protein
MEQKIAIRLYDNPKFGKTFGKGMYYNAIYNGTLDLPEKRIKYLVDLVQFEKWQHTAQTDVDMDAVKIAMEIYAAKGIDISAAPSSSNILCSYVKRFDSHMSKPKVAGLICVDLRTCELNVILVDEQNSIALNEKFSMRPCRDKNGNSPDFFASNYDADMKLKRAA